MANKITAEGDDNTKVSSSCFVFCNVINFKIVNSKKKKNDIFWIALKWRCLFYKNQFFQHLLSIYVCVCVGIIKL